MTGVMTVARPQDVARRPTSVGRPEFGVTLEAVDDDGNLIPPRTVGNLRCKSPQAADPLDGEGEDSQHPGRQAGYWHTDDRGWFDEEGYLYLAGRRSNLIIRASVNIYAEEL